MRIPNLRALKKSQSIIKIFGKRQKMEVESSQNSNKVFELKKWNAVAIWYWNTKIENCAICK